MALDSAILKLDGEHVMLAGIKNFRITNADQFIGSIRAINKRVAVQAIDANFAAGKEHILGILQQSLHARKSGTMLSKRIEIDVLLRLACTNQISKALDDVGLKDGINNVLIIGIGKVSDLQAVKKHLVKNYKLGNVLKLSARKTKLLYSHHKIGREEINACINGNKLASILAERANLLW
jgi:tRNA threonylcarbamoyladenosine modification (KEOPS) complex Cgi121 subunit